MVKGLDDQIAAAREWEALLAEVRAIEGMADFLLPPRLDPALEGPVALVSVARERCDALIVTGSRVQEVPLPGVTRSGVEERARAYFAAVGEFEAILLEVNRLRRRLLQESAAPDLLFRYQDALTAMDEVRTRMEAVLLETLRWLWDAIAAPIISALEPPAGTIEKPPVGAGEKPPAGTADESLSGTGGKSPVGAGEESPVGIGEKSSLGAGGEPPVGAGEKPSADTGGESLAGAGGKPPVGAGEKLSVDTGEGPLAGTGKPPVGAGEEPPAGSGEEPGGKSPAGIGEELPRLWWCPTGLLTLLPLHAAGYHDGTGRSVLDHVVSSYTPSLRALAEARRRGPSGRGGMLVVALPETEGQAPLPSVKAELTLLERMFAGAELTVLAGDEATRARVRAAMRDHEHFHFSCHGTQDLTRPSHAGLLLPDGVLSVADLIADRFEAQFAFLSACKTATGGVVLSDEAITLASALHHLGCRHVIATLWSVYDAAAAKVAEGVYERLATEHGFAPENAARALHQTVLDLRRAHPDEPSVWLPFTHTGP